MAEHVPIRTCVACRRQRPKSELVRLADTPDGVRADLEQRLPGRGTYVCPDLTCIDAAASRDARAVRRGLRGASAPDVLKALDHLRTIVRQPTPDDEQPPSASKEP